MIDAPHVSGIAHLIGDATRAAMLTALKQDRSLSAMELSRVAGVAPSTASGHLAMLVQGGLVHVEPSGRHRYYRLARSEVADALEAMESLAVAAIPADRLGPPMEPATRFARICYDHLAGTVAVAVARALVDAGYLKTGRRGFTVTGKGRRFFAGIGIDVAALSARPRVLARQCADWSEQRSHVGGALGAALLERLLELGWLRPGRRSRSITLTARGRRELGALLDVELDGPHAGRGSS